MALNPLRGPNRERGFTLIEAMTVVIIFGMLLVIGIPHLRVSPYTEARDAGMQLVRELEAVRTRALATRSAARVVFDPSGGSYTGYLDANRDSVIVENAAEQQALRTLAGRRPLSRGMAFGRGVAGGIPGDTAGGAITFVNDRLEFNGRGVTSPFGTRGVIYLAHTNKPDAVVAVAVSGSASMKLWIYKEGTWQ